MYILKSLFLALAVTSIASASSCVSLDAYLQGPVLEPNFESTCSASQHGASASLDCSAYPNDAQFAMYRAHGDASKNAIHGEGEFNGNLWTDDPSINFAGWVSIYSESTYKKHLIHPGTGFVELDWEYDLGYNAYARFLVNDEFVVDGQFTGTYRKAQVPVDFSKDIVFYLFGGVTISEDTNDWYNLEISNIHYLDSNMNLIENPRFTPEPSTYALLGPALGLLFWRKRNLLKR